MLKRALSISMAFIGVIVGAGFASGQEAMQYFVAFGNWGLAGVIIAGLLMAITGVSMLQLGSYFQASEHTAVYSKVARPLTSKILDISTIITLFGIGFVMFAGGGATINQQFPSVPVWVGAAVMLVLVLLTGLLNVNKVTSVIGAITPFIIIFIVLATSVTIFHAVSAGVDFGALNSYAETSVDPAVGSWWLAALNYTGLNVMCAVSMSIVIGGNFLDNRAVGLGGMIGGFFYLALLALLVFALYFVAADVNGTALPVLELINQIHPAFGYVMTFIIYGMVFNTAVGMFYAMGKRLTRGNPGRFYPIFAIVCVVGFALSFVGFKSLVANVYPILGYLGLLMIAVMSVTWLRNRSTLVEEGDRRLRARRLVRKKIDPRLRFNKSNDQELAQLADASNMDTQEFVEVISEDIYDELEEDKEIDFDRTEQEPGVVYVEHTEPEAGNGGAEQPGKR
ncbi:membrane protein [Corynebacterium phocae]|uniref:Membrane protein n=1 Tax=Corynebacterium phocae TaxID=161895 RepID=A0A1L7D677_9CORY|nr:hypothetical protein [Corynebacterium phocae]APT93577.1 membrane protein [Corynebacterium phocae]KAA8728505.1 hypothetical protein F4V58_00585 [Corynebacterium phocae]